MKFPAPKTLTGAVSPMLLINWIFGLGVIQYPIGRPRRIISAVWSIINLTIIMSFVRMADFPGIAKVQKTAVEANNYFVNGFVVPMFVASSICLARMKAKIVADTFLTLDGINDRLGILGIPNDYDLIFKAQIIQLGVAFVSIFTLVMLDLKYIFDDKYPSATSRIGFELTCYYYSIIAFSVNYTVSGSMRYFSNRFQRLNTLLIETDSRDIGESTTAQLDRQLQSYDQFPHYSSVIHEIHGNNSQSIRAAKKQWLLFVIRETRMDDIAVNNMCRKIHRRLCKAAMKLNKAFSMQILVSLASTFHLITTFLYTCYAAAEESFENRSFDGYWIPQIITIMWVMLVVMAIILIVDTCDATSCEANRTGGVIGKLFDTAAHDDDIRDEMNIFSLQLQQNPLYFTANGLFSLDYSLIHRIIGSVTTYLIIMIQMQSIHEPEKMNTTPYPAMLMRTNGTD